MLTRISRLTACAVLALPLAISACGTTPGDRAVSGGLLGAGAGAAIGSLSGSAATGAVIGGVGGAKPPSQMCPLVGVERPMRQERPSLISSLSPWPASEPAMVTIFIPSRLVETPTIKI